MPTLAERRRKNAGRMIGVFGMREMELAAIEILDDQWDQPFNPVDTRIFDTTDSLEGFKELVKLGWIGRDHVPTITFWQRVHGR